MLVIINMTTLFMQLSKSFRSATLATLASSTLAQAGDAYSDAGSVEQTVERQPFSLADIPDAFVDIGKLYKNDENPIIQQFSVHGRINYQTALLNGNDALGQDFRTRFSEVRRARLGTKFKFLNYFNLKFTANLADDDRATGGELDWGYDSIDEAYIGFDIKKAFGIESFDKLHIIYGVPKFDLGGEANESSKKIVTAERSGISNKVYVNGSRPTGFKLNAIKGDWDFVLGLYSTEENPEFDAKWDQGLAYQGTAGYQVNNELKVVADFLYNDSDVDEENQWDYQWAASLRADYTAARWGVSTEIIAGDNGDERHGNIDTARQGHFWAAVVTPYYFLIEDKLQASFQYQYAGSSQGEGIQTTSRYLARDQGAGIDVNDGLGDEHHSFYLGLNYLISGHNAKILTGIQYDDLKTPTGTITGTTLWFAYRTFF